MIKLEQMILNVRKMFVVLMVVLCLISTIEHLTSAPIDVNRNNIAVVKWEERLINAKQLLPINRGTVGYISEWDVPGAEYDEWDQEVEFLLTRYSFAPLLIVKGIKAEWNVAVLKPGSLTKWSQLNADQNLEITSTGNGVYLIHKLGD